MFKLAETLAALSDAELARVPLADDVRAEFVRTRAHGTWHCCGTCRMGTADDPMAVTDATGRVYGVDGLRVADASLMPFVPRANTNLPVMMIGEKIAAAILEARD